MGIESSWPGGVAESHFARIASFIPLGMPVREHDIPPPAVNLPIFSLCRAGNDHQQFNERESRPLVVGILAHDSINQKKPAEDNNPMEVCQTNCMCRRNVH